MSINAETKKRIWQYMLEHIDRDDAELISKTVSAFDISRTTVYNYLKKLMAENSIAADGDKACGYSLNATAYHFTYTTGVPLEEDRIFSQDMAPILKDYPKNVYEIHRYIFTEMMNNAIEHAQAQIINTAVYVDSLNTKVYIFDDGIGIFRKIQQYFEDKGEMLSLDEAVDALFPGKLTTAEKSHSGEGIFFSSRAADRFTIISGGKVFRHDIFTQELSTMGDTVSGKGTCVFYCVANSGRKQLKDVFDMFSDSEKGFFKTQIPIAHMFSSGCPVSRSEARRLGGYIRRFEEVTLDFKDVSSIGQAFAHELFIVFADNNPEIHISVENAGDDVAKMINRVKKTKY